MRCKKLKKMMTCSIIAMSLGAGMMAAALTSKKTKDSTARLINNAMNMANNKLNEMKQ